MAADPITAGLGLVDDVVTRIWPDATEKDKEKITVALAQLKARTDEDTSQASTNTAEAANTNMFVAGWRPFVGWVCGAALAYQYILTPLGMWIGFVVGHPIPKPPTLDADLWQLMFGMLGMGGLRTFEKFKGIQSNH